MKKRNIFENLYKQLKQKYGSPKGQWKLWCKRPKTEKEREEVIIEAILTQRANWKNVELAFENLKKARVDSLKDIYEKGEERVAPLIKASGFYKAKASYLFHLSEFILKNYGSLKEMRKEKLEVLREKLLKLKGIGYETADSILLYALEKPIFVIDEYTRRLVKRYNLSKDLSYHFLQELFEKNLKRDFRLYQDFHALIVIEGKNRNL
ncbi:hypothetical protein J7J39_01915 [bacterium]|nr:hypothetical protein [bacterium]